MRIKTFSMEGNVSQMLWCGALCSMFAEFTEICRLESRQLNMFLSSNQSDGKKIHLSVGGQVP
jgi:hypothetical protein